MVLPWLPGLPLPRQGLSLRSAQTWGSKIIYMHGVACALCLPPLPAFSPSRERVSFQTCIEFKLSSAHMAHRAPPGKGSGRLVIGSPSFEGIFLHELSTMQHHACMVSDSATFNSGCHAGLHSRPGWCAVHGAAGMPLHTAPAICPSRPCWSTEPVARRM